MRLFSSVFTLLSVFFFASCTDCTDCTPFSEEPYININFLNKSDSSRRVIIIDSINHIYGKELRHFADTTNEFKFPLDMHHDTSIFEIIYRDTSNLLSPLTNTITVTYQREFLRRDDNYVIVECDIQNFTTNFDIDTLRCKESANLKCISNEAIATIYN